MREKRAIENIRKFGWHIVNVFGDEHSIEFSYTIGLYKTFDVPELFLSGLNGNIASTVLNNIGDQISNGLRITPGMEYDDFFEGYNCYFDLVNKINYDKYFGQAIGFYHGKEFQMLQCVWPNRDRKYPWEVTKEFIQDILISKPSSDLSPK